MKDCIFCKIVNKEIRGKIVYEDKVCMAFDDVSPQAPVHVILVPKGHIPTFSDLGEEQKDLLGHITMVINKITEIKEIKEDGFRIVVNSNPAGGQTVYHLHFHIMGGRQMIWPPG